MRKEPEVFFSGENDRKDQEFRRNINAATSYTENERCDRCGDRLNGYTFECMICKALVCPLHSYTDGCCPEHTGLGKENVHED